MHWRDIKNKVLFSYLNCDWISIDVIHANYDEIKSFLTDKIDLETNPKGIINFVIGDTRLCLYNNDLHHFDFDPKEVDNEKKWSSILELLKTLSKQLDKRVVLRPEDSEKGQEDFYLVSIQPNGKVDYNDSVIKKYSNHFRVEE